MTTARTGVVVLLGHPVSHSLSPQIHTAAFAAAGVDAVYVAADVAPAHLPAAVDGMRALGVLGANVTVPHKQAVVALVDELTPEAELVGAVNTLFRAPHDGGRWVGDNTDASGLRTVLERNVGLADGDVVEIFGAGGAARAAAVALGRLHARVRVTARRPDAAAEVAALAARAGARLGDDAVEPRVIINATPLGLHGEALPERYLNLSADQVALDLVYGDRDTPFVQAARERGVAAFDGLGMLVAQAAGSFERWTGRPAPLTAMTQAVPSRGSVAPDPEARNPGGR